jgi:hypothetical protein
MAGLDAAIHRLREMFFGLMDARIKSGHDERKKHRHLGAASFKHPQ